MRKMTPTQAATCGENLKVKVTPEQSEKMQKAWFAAGKAWKGGDRKTAWLHSKYIFLYSDGTLTGWGEDDWFNNHENEEIELIDDIAEYTIDELINMRDVYFFVNETQSKDFKRKWNGKNNLLEGWDYYIVITENGYLTWESESLKHNITERLVKIKPTWPQQDFSSQQEIWLWLSSGNGNMVKCENNIVGFRDNKLFSFSHNSYCDFYFKDYQNWQKHIPPKLIRVNGIEVPAPLEKWDGTSDIYIACLSLIQKYIKVNDMEINIAFENFKDLCYATKEDAIARAEAMMKYEVIE